MSRSVPLGAICFAEYEEGFLDFVELAASRGLVSVEFKYEEPARSAPGSRDPEKLSALMRRHGIAAAVHLPFDGLNIADLDDGMLELSRQRELEGIAFAASIGATRATIHSGSLRSVDYSPAAFAESRRRCLGSLALVLDAAEEAGVSLCLENGNGFGRASLMHAVSPGQMLAIREELGGRLGFTLDFGHATFFGRDPSYLVEELGSALVLLSHLHDNSGLADQHRPLGTGVLDLEKLLRRYIAGGWSFPLHIEHKRVGDLEASIERFDETLARLDL